MTTGTMKKVLNLAKGVVMFIICGGELNPPEASRSHRSYSRCYPAFPLIL
ncbi:hypothetical protein DY000_02032223 [Brassica cretica]|uniref:Uncharacterized protein n=1 Tax=Brassica cretica TaxID=69181 RepID=A0ABQ7DKV2_BRACR|nr:hypothetical protein DY000_02032223 [Brassica cretica]